jgi:hypothetical protein
MTTSHLTPRILVAVMLAAIAIGVPVTAQRVSESELLLREALHKQQVQGDLPGAIKIYQQIVSARNGDRSVSGRALLELAGCYEKLGQQAEAVYQRIVRDFADQPVAVQARARLAALRPAAPAPAMTLRKLEVPGDILNVIRTDGQRAVFLGGPAEDSTLFFGDLSGKEKRTVGPWAGNMSTSPDLSAVVTYRQNGQQLSITKTDGSGARVLELRENGKPFTVGFPGPLSMSWSWDNRYVLITNTEATGSRLLRITVADGTVTEVQPGLRGVGESRFSPDGQFIAYWRAGIHVIPSGGGESHRIATVPFLVDWTRDGRYVLINQRRADGWLLSAVPVRQGRGQGEPIALRSLPGPRVATMTNGSLFVSTGNRSNAIRDTWLGTLDDATGSVTWTSLNLVGSPIPARTPPPWSRDGTRFAYVTGEDSQSTRVVRVKTIETGDDRELYRADNIHGCVAAHHQNVLFCVRVMSAEDGQQIFSVSLDSGRAEIRGTVPLGWVIEQMTADDRKIVFYQRGTNSLFEWEIATGEQRAVSLYRSEDARWSLSRRFGADSIQIRPAADGADWRPLLARSSGPGARVVQFSPDGNWVLHYNRDGLYRIATDGGEPQRLGDYPTPYITASSLSISPDGRRFIVHAVRERGRWTGDYWVLENFLPPAPGLPAVVNKAAK